MSGVLTVLIQAPADDQPLFKLLPEEERKNPLQKPWVQETVSILQKAVNQCLETFLLQGQLYPINTNVSVGVTVDQQGVFYYAFQIPVQNFPPGSAGGHSGQPANTDGMTPQ